MSRRFTELSFIIGLFFTLVSVILISGYFFTEALSSKINIYSGLVFLLFGALMMLVTSGKNREKP